MVKKSLFFLVLGTILWAKPTIYERNCIPCHEDLAVKIDKFFFRYLLKYSSEAEVKKAMIAYLKNPKAEHSILQDGLIHRFGVKKKSTLKEDELNLAIDEYWKRYNVFERLK
ncbi:hypothetical protein [Sulfurospirillum deleyianum]|uniref:Cytochrome c domain-containing protein n=1 Tax=Sulfurospirillum deleyianum (strain ATCC 51133 / DSM 6946 / 5175) TaxID=525898 RepID=D1AYZ5_SULD5|nr:hypothetical protein [Sulfurospirillum deleyianum]ACZ11133.1 conserved hypothetical protein [Sulfurospirillum deleyianum DSM 6946]